MINTYKILVRKPEGKILLSKSRLWIILKILRGGVIDLFDLEQGQVKGFCKHGDEPSHSVTYDKLRDHKVLNKDSIPCNLVFCYIA